ncbi:MAG: hypothetical protein A3F13_02595 [Gammaproteobacteria bacterium RIFCSPHIGHO2_12_FULL_40_19]|nr:MAG: hypothetical protein A3F13_02595 [Gammaproteobacteria bacterium RIFCSPHIGHO2_12_FULL_40_19]
MASGFDNDVMFADNVDFSAGSPVEGKVTADGQLLIGATASPNIRVSTLTAGSGMTITNGEGSITLSAGTTVATTYTTDSGNAIPVANILNVLGGTGVETSGSGNTVTIDASAATPLSFPCDSGTATPAANALTLAGSGSITTTGSGSTATTALTGLTNHAVLVGAGTSTITKVGPTATAGQVLQSAGASADPAFSTATYPLTTTVSQILYSSATNTVAGLATANRGVLTTGATGVPVITALATDGQLIIGSTAGAPAAATLTAGTGVTITPGSNSITIAATGSIMWTDVTGTSQNAAVNNGYVANNTSLVTITLPASFAVGDIVRVAGLNTGLWSLVANTGDIINFGSSPTSAGGSLTATNRYDAVEVVGVVANTTWIVLSSVGNLTVA